MNHPIYRVVSISIVAPFTLQIVFDDGKERVIDFSPILEGLRVHHHLIMAQAMAFQNATWLVETAKCGFEDGFRMFGHSLIVAPTGEIAVKSSTEEDEVIFFNADIELAANLKRTMFNFAAHRRPEHYRMIVERVGAEVTPANERKT